MAARTQNQDDAVDAPRPTRPLTPIALGFLAVFGPFSMNLYLPLLPSLTSDLATTDALAQVTVTACLLGLAGGQLIVGPLSDRYGRRRPLLVGVAGYVAASLLCAAAPTIEVLLIAHLLQGATASAGVVVALAAGRDLYSGSTLIAYYGRFTVLSGLAGAVSPVLGGAIAAVTDWRGCFLVLAGMGAVVLALAGFGLPETLPPQRRGTGRSSLSGFRVLLANRAFLSVVLVMGFLNAAQFAYISGSTFVLQNAYGMSPQGYSLVIGLSSAGYMLFGWLAGRWAERWGMRAALVISLVVALVGSGGVLLVALTGLPLAVMIVALVLVVAGAAAGTTATTSLGMSAVPDMAGTASSLLGMARYAFGAVAAPLLGFVGSDDITTALGIIVLTLTLLGVASAGGALRRRAPAAPHDVVWDKGAQRSQNPPNVVRGDRETGA